MVRHLKEKGPVSGAFLHCGAGSSLLGAEPGVQQLPICTYTGSMNRFLGSSEAFIHSISSSLKGIRIAVPVSI